MLVLAVSLLLTAITIQQSYTLGKLLHSNALALQNNLHERENLVDNFLNNPQTFGQLKTIGTNEKNALALINRFSKDKNIFFSTYQNKKIQFWSDNCIVPDNCSAYHNGSDFVKENNGFLRGH